jgi:uncharacterized protein YjeT (DUF2065 family)
MTLATLLQGVAVVLALEGLLYAIAPGAMRRALRALSAAPEERLRVGGIAAAAIGVAVAWALQGGA